MYLNLNQNNKYTLTLIQTDWFRGNYLEKRGSKSYYLDAILTQ